ncbi:hypothetical protein [Cellulomonas taurus]|uniref:hypothetical protein n=1 Tax=Cellulomonas taurus TaxID=2729175 RepID=UPI00145DE7B1|nr:hypothetical protein [Cellulomonas taurus]
MAVEQWKVYADVTNPDSGQVGSTVGTSIAAGVSGGLYWFLDKAGITVAEVKTVGRLYP